MANVLIVEDDDNFFNAEEAFVSKLGHTVSRAVNPDEFLSATVNQVFSLIIMDMQFPGGGAPYAAKLIANKPELTSLPFIFCSAMPIDEVQKWFPPTPLRRFIRKPPDFSFFQKYIQELLPLQQATKSLSAPAQTNLANQMQGAINSPEAQRNANDTAPRLVDMILNDALRAGASDIHFDPDRALIFVRYRIDGQLRDQATYPKAVFPIISRLRIMAGLPPTPASNAGAEDGSFDVAVSGPPVRVRLSSFPVGYGEKIVLRLLDMAKGNMSLDSFGFAPEVLDKFKRLIQLPNGLMVTSGATGSGKTTTLMGVLQFLNRPDINIMTLEDPIEYQLPRVNHAQINTKANFSFADGLRAILRQDPNVIMVGEMRDAETAEIALRAATTGHKIFSTIHATNSAGVVSRLLGMGIEPFMIASGLIGSLSQRIVRRICTNCAQPTSPTPAIIALVQKAMDPIEADAVKTILQAPNAKWSAGAGCETCRGTGFKGRVGVFELMIVDAAIREMIMNKTPAEDIQKYALKTGMKSSAMDAVSKAAWGWTTLEESYRAMML